MKAITIGLLLLATSSAVAQDRVARHLTCWKACAQDRACMQQCMGGVPPTQVPVQIVPRPRMADPNCTSLLQVDGVKPNTAQATCTPR